MVSMLIRLIMLDQGCQFSQQRKRKWSLKVLHITILHNFKRRERLFTHHSDELLNKNKRRENKIKKLLLKLTRTRHKSVVWFTLKSGSKLMQTKPIYILGTNELVQYSMITSFLNDIYTWSSNCSKKHNKIEFLRLLQS